MFVTIRRYQGQPGQTDEVVRRVQQGLVPIVSKQHGFVSYHAVDVGNDVAVSISMYESRADADAANAAAASWVKANLSDLIGPAEVTVGEVRVAATASRV